MTTLLDTTNWVDYPFTVNGINFVSKLDPSGSFYPQVESMPAGVFSAMNTSAVIEIIGNPAELSNDELVSELERINAGASQALICLAQLQGRADNVSPACYNKEPNERK